MKIYVAKVLTLVYVKRHKVNLQDNYGKSHQQIACSYNRSNIVETLLLAEADEIITNESWKTLARVAQIINHNELLKLLDRCSL